MRPVRSLEDRFWEKVDVGGPDDCWHWRGASTYHGYGKINLGRNADGYDLAHRVSWRFANGDIPEGLQMDHLCRNPSCVNPAHLEAVTAQENIRRGRAPSILIHLSGRCARGHHRSESYIRKGTNRVVYCRACRRENRARARLS